MEKRGILHIYHDKPSFEAGLSVNALLQQGGLDRRAVTSDEIHQIEPALQGKDFGGFYTPSDSTGDIHKFTRGLTDACLRKGARFINEASVETIASTNDKVAIHWEHRAVATEESGVNSNRRSTIDADRVIICAGVESRRLASMLGDRVNVYPVKGYSITVNLETPESRAASPRVSLLDEAAKIVTSRLGQSRFRVAGTAEFNGFNRDIRDVRIDPLVAWTRQLFRSVSTERVIPWAGLRPMTPSMLPRVGAGRRAGVFYNTGHGHLGWTLSAATARIVADAVDSSLSSTATRHAGSLAWTTG